MLLMVEKLLKKYNECFIIDLHSFSDEFVYKMFNKKNNPDICIGINKSNYDVDLLEKTIKEDGTFVTKEYVKGRKNVYSHPAIADYNRTTDSANKTVSTLMKIIISLRKDDVTEEDDPLLQIIAGGRIEK